MNHPFIKIYFQTHYLLSYLGCFGWIISKYGLFIQLLILTSWYLNKNRCIVSQIEYYYLGRTFMGEGPKYHVPSYFRIMMKLNTLLGIYYYTKLYF